MENDYSIKKAFFSLSPANTPEELRVRLLEELVADAEGNLKQAIARDPRTPIHILERLAGTFSMAVLSYEVNLAIALAENPRIPANLLESLWGTHDPQTDTGTAITVAICTNPNAPGSLLETIDRTYWEVEVSRTTPNAGTYYGKVRFAIANNPATAENERLAYLRECVAKNSYSRNFLSKN